MREKGMDLTFARHINNRRMILFKIHPDLSAFADYLHLCIIRKHMTSARRKY